MRGVGAYWNVGASSRKYGNIGWYFSGEEPGVKSGDNTVGIVAGILGALVLIVIIIIAVLLYKR